MQHLQKLHEVHFNPNVNLVVNIVFGVVSVSALMVSFVLCNDVYGAGPAFVAVTGSLALCSFSGQKMCAWWDLGATQAATFFGSVLLARPTVRSLTTRWRSDSSACPLTHLFTRRLVCCLNLPAAYPRLPSSLTHSRAGPSLWSLAHVCISMPFLSLLLRLPQRPAPSRTWPANHQVLRCQEAVAQL
jgi:hypothetical protein